MTPKLGVGASAVGINGPGANPFGLAASPPSPYPLARFEPAPAPRFEPSVAGVAWARVAPGFPRSALPRGRRRPPRDTTAQLAAVASRPASARARLPDCERTGTEEVPHRRRGYNRGCFSACTRLRRPSPRRRANPARRLELFGAGARERPCRRDRGAARTSRLDAVFRAPAAPSSITAGPRRAATATCARLRRPRGGRRAHADDHPTAN